MAKLVLTLIALPITNVANTIRALLQNSTKKKWLFTGASAALSATTGNMATIDGGGNVAMRSLDPGEDFSDSLTWSELTVTVEGTEKIRVLSGLDNLAALYKTPETIYFKHLGEIIDGFVKGKFPGHLGATAVIVDQTVPSIWVTGTAQVDNALDGVPVAEAEIEVDAPSNDFGE